jgi:hypothetical protein
MYVVSIYDRGEERNFLATSLSFVGTHVEAVINGTPKSFDLIDLVGIEGIESFSEDAHCYQRSQQRRVS